MEWIEINPVQYGVNPNVSTGAGGRGREGANPHISEIVVAKEFDGASPKLYPDAVAGAFNTKIEINLTATTKNKIDTYLAIELMDCGVSGYSTSSGDDLPMESLSLNFTKIMYTPPPLDLKGTPVKGAVVAHDLLKTKAS